MAPPRTPAPARTRRRPFGLPAALGRILAALAVLAGLLTVPQAAVALDNPFPDTIQSTNTTGFDGLQGIAIAPDGGVWVTNFNSDRLIGISQANVNFTGITVGDTPYGVAAASNGRAYVTNFNGNSVSVINTSTNAVVATIMLGSGRNPTAVAVSPDATRAYVTNQTANTVSVINTSTNGVATIPVGAAPIGVAVSPDGTRAYVTNRADGTVSVINTSSNGVVATIPVDTNPFGVVVSSDGTRVYVTNSGSGTVSVIDPTSNSVVETISGLNFPYRVAIAPDSGYVFVTDPVNGVISVIDPSNNSVVGSISAGVGIREIAVGADGRVWVTNFNTNSVSVLQRAFSVAFNLNGASGEEPPMQTVFLNETATEPVSDPSRPGYRFLGWADTQNAPDGPFFNFNEPIASGPNTLYAQWEAFGLRVEKFDTLDGSTLADGGDHDDAGDARTLVPGRPTPLSVTVENISDEESLTGFIFADEKTDGTGTVPVWSCNLIEFNVGEEITSDGEDFDDLLASLELPAGGSFTCTGELPDLGWGASHTDQATVRAVGLMSEDLVEASDPWNAVTPEAPAPGLEVQKWVCETGTGCADPFGQDLIDLASGTAAGGWADTARVDAGDTVDWLITVRNTGDTELAHVVLSDDTVDLAGAVAPDCAPDAEIASSLEAGAVASVVCSSTGVTASHTNTAEVTGTVVYDGVSPVPDPSDLEADWTVSDTDFASVTVLMVVFVEKLAVNEDNVLAGMNGSSWEIRTGPEPNGQVVTGSAVTPATDPSPVAGLFEVTGLAAPGTYYLVETQAPPGFSLLAQAVPFTLTDAGTVSDDPGWPANVRLADVPGRGWTISVEDVPALVLPASGGPGDAWLRGPGAALVLAAGAAIGLLWRGRARRRRRRVVIGLGGPMSGSLRGPRPGSA